MDDSVKIAVRWRPVPYEATNETTEIIKLETLNDKVSIFFF